MGYVTFERLTSKAGVMTQASEKQSLIQQFIHYLRDEKNASPHTCRNYLRDLEQFEAFLKSSGTALSPQGEVVIERVDRLVVRKYLSFLHRKNRKSSIARKLSTLRSFFKYLMSEQIISSNPAKPVSTPKVEKLLPTVLTVDEAFRLVESPLKLTKSREMELRNRALLELLYSCGIRVSELVGLNRDRVDFELGIVKVMGKGRKERIVPVGAKAIEALVNYLEARETVKDESPLFVNSRGGRLTSRSVARVVKKRQGVRASFGRLVPTASAIPLPPTCWMPGLTFAKFRRCLDMPVSRPLRDIPTSLWGN